MAMPTKRRHWLCSLGRHQDGGTGRDEIYGRYSLCKRCGPRPYRKKSNENVHNTAKPLTKRSIFDKIQSSSKHQRNEQISKNPKKETAMSKNTNTKTPKAPKQKRDWARIRETAKTIALTILATGILAFAAGVAYERGNTESIRTQVAAEIVAEAPESK